jgi:hypothetical protein
MSKAVLFASALLATACGALPAAADDLGVSVGALSCDVSSTIAMVVRQKQTLRCTFHPANGGPGELYRGRIDEYGLAIGAVAAGQIVWGVLAPSTYGGVPHGALAGTYAGPGAQISIGGGVGANLLVGGTGQAISLQPVALEGHIGVNIAAGVTRVMLWPAQ